MSSFHSTEGEIPSSNRNDNGNSKNNSYRDHDNGDSQSSVHSRTHNDERNKISNSNIDINNGEMEESNNRNDDINDGDQVLNGDHLSILPTLIDLIHKIQEGDSKQVSSDGTSDGNTERVYLFNMFMNRNKHHKHNG